MDQQAGTTTGNEHPFQTMRQHRTTVTKECSLDMVSELQNMQDIGSQRSSQCLRLIDSYTLS
jgi:hypothetical protein